jgi:hypothetical protein
MGRLSRAPEYPEQMNELFLLKSNNESIKPVTYLKKFSSVTSAFSFLRLLFGGTGLFLDELGANDARMLLIFAAGR